MMRSNPRRKNRGRHHLSCTKSWSPNRKGNKKGQQWKPRSWPYRKSLPPPLARLKQGGRPPDMQKNIGPGNRRLVLSDGEEVLWTSNSGNSTSYSDGILAPTVAKAEVGKAKKRKKNPLPLTNAPAK